VSVPVFRLFVSLFASTALFAGVVVSRSEKGLEFTNAVAVTIHGKNKAVTLGNQPKIAGPIGKLPSTKLAGSLLKEHDSNTIGIYESGNIEYIIPQGLPKTTAPDPAAIWRANPLTYKASQSDKAGTEIATDKFLAYLENGVEELARLCMDEKGLELIAGKGKAFPAQVELLSAVVKAYPTDPAVAPLERYVEGSMRRRYDQFESGTAGVEVLAEGLKFSELSLAAYPNRPEQERLRKALADRKAWLERRIAILRAFEASEQWDTYLLAERDFERYERAYPEMLKKHTQALKQSVELHKKLAAIRLADAEYGAAYKEFRAATFRQPSDSVLQEEARQAWTEYSRRVAIDRQAKRERLNTGQHDAVERYLFFAEQNKQTKGLDEALKNVIDAESILKKSLPANTVAPESLKVLYKKAEILGSQGKVSEALAILDEYDQYAVDDERQPANQLRNQLLFQLDKNLKEVITQVQKNWSEANFHRTRELSVQGLRVKADDPELLFHAGISSMITRHPKEGRAYLTSYLNVSNTLDANAEQRLRVRRLLPLIHDEGAAAEVGDPNWLSGKKLAKGVFYCPISLAFQPRVERIDASNKMQVAFDWNGDRLKSITPSFDKPEHATGEKKISFAYDDGVPQVASVGYENEVAAVNGANPDDAIKRFSFVLLNNRFADPIALETVNGKSVTAGIAGNRFFQPFAWEKIYFFRFTYDTQGRVSEAREIVDQRGTLGDYVVRFDWNGQQLMALRGYQGADEQHRTQVYERTMQYQDGKLVSEEIQSQGKPSRIKYVYNGSRIVSATCDKDPSLDSRSRQVTFLSNSPSTQVK
jgi:hypothetical protein